MSKQKSKPQKTKPNRHWPLHLHHRSSRVVITAVLVGLALISYFGRSQLAANNTAAAANQNQITITAAGFSPVTLNIKTGSAVTWLNDDTRAHQIIADPSADNPPPLSFDDGLVLQTGDSYTFSFIHPGTYNYHDLLSPVSGSGVIIVQ